MKDKPNILFLCTGNACRSQIAEGWGRALKGDRFNFWSAGTEVHGLNPYAVKVMKEAGVDISDHTSTKVNELDVQFDMVFTVCGHADEICPVFSGAPKIVYVGFDDPPRLAKGARSEDEALGHYRRVRDEIRAFIERIEDYLA